MYLHAAGEPVDDKNASDKFKAWYEAVIDELEKYHQAQLLIAGEPRCN